MVTLNTFLASVAMDAGSNDSNGRSGVGPVGELDTQSLAEPQYCVFFVSLCLLLSM